MSSLRFRRVVAGIFALMFVSVAVAQEIAPSAQDGAAAAANPPDLAKQYADLRKSRNRATRALADRYYDLMRIQEWTDVTGRFKTKAKYVAHDPDMKWVKLATITGSGDNRVTKESTIEVAKLNKASQAKVRQIAALQKKLDALLESEDDAATTDGESRDEGDMAASDVRRAAPRRATLRSDRDEDSEVRGVGQFGQARVEPGKVTLEAPGNHGGFFGFAFSPDGDTLAGGTGVVTVDTGNGAKVAFGGDVVLWNTRTGKFTKKLGEHGTRVDWLAYSADGRWLASASKKNGIIKVWDAQAGSMKHTFELPGGKILAVALSADGKTVAAIAEKSRAMGERTIQEGGELVAWDADTGARKWSVPDSSASHVAISPDGQTLAVYSQKVGEGKPDKEGKATWKYVEPRFTLFDTASGNVKAKFDLKRSISLKFIMFLPRTDRLGVLETKGLSQLDLRTGQMQDAIEWDKERWAFSSAAFSADGKQVARAWSDWVEVVDVATGTVEGLRKVEFPNTWSNVVFAADLTRIACSQQGGAIIDIANLEPPANAASRSER